jgi:hypothetical protein
MTSVRDATRVNQPLRPLRRGTAGAGAGGAPAWPSFTGSADLVGTSNSGVTVYVDQALGAPGRQNAEALLAATDTVVAQNNAIFGIGGKPVDVIVFALNGATDGSGGADHDGCDFNTGNAIEVDASLGSPERVAGLFEAELSECAMNGRLCGFSTGEALSRWCAAVASNNALADFATAPQWADDRMPNWVDHTEHTDQDPISTGCGMAFISWLIHEGLPLPRIAPRMVHFGDSGTLADLYADLTGQTKASAWPSFQAALNALPGGVTSDDPFDAFAEAMKQA